MNAADGKKPNSHLAYLDGLRACLALYIVAHHSYWEVYATKPGAVSELLSFLRLGRFAVDWFIVLSGYCLILPVVRHDLTLQGGALLFYRKRARRILPTFYAALIICTLLAVGPLSRKTGAHWDISLPVLPKSVLANALLVQDAWQVSRINHAFWSIAVEWRIYFLLPPLVWLWRRFGPVAISVSAALSLICLAVVVNRVPRLSPVGTTLDYTGLFIFGCLAGWIGHQPRFAARRRTNWVCYGLAGLTLMIVPLLIKARHFNQFQQIAMADSAFGVTAASLLAAWSLAPMDLLRRGLATRPLPAIGTFGYSLYLMHAPIVHATYLGVARLNLSATAETLVEIGAGLIASLAVAYPFFLIFERPFMSSRQKKAVIAEGAVPS